MRSKTDLQAQATELGIPWTEEMSSAQLMDLLRDQLAGHEEGREWHLQLDPMKAKDLKAQIAWGTETPWAGIEKYLTTDYFLEPKLDGARARLHLGIEQNRITTGRRSVKTFSYIRREANFPLLRDAVIEGWDGIVLDGELLAPVADVVLDEKGTKTVGLLNATMALVNISPEKSIARQAIHGPVKFWAFDIIAMPGHNVQALAYTQRRELLEFVVAKMAEFHPEAPIQVVPQFASESTNIDACLAAGFEGAVLKHRDGRYQPGKRSADWLKVKTMGTGDCFVTGDSKPGEGRHTGKVGALMMGVYDAQGQVVEVAQHGAFTDEFRDLITDPATGGVKAELIGTVMELMGQGRTKDNRLRHPHLVRLRPDKEAVDCTLEAWNDALPMV